MRKYELLPLQLMHEGVITESDIFSPALISYSDIHRVHNDDYLDRLINLKLSAKEQRLSGFPHTKQLIQREIEIVSGTVRCAEKALNNGFAFNIAGGTHHAFADRAEGFCLLNDQAIAAQYLIDQKLSHQILIIDLDVHQGNGTASIFQNRPDVFTFSMHGKKNYPFKKETSDLDIELDDGTGNQKYLQKLEQNLRLISANFIPDFIFYQAGVDVLFTDQLGKISLDLDGSMKRDEIVFEYAERMSVPIVTCMGGGYSKDLNIILKAHVNTFKAALKILG